MHIGFDQNREMVFRVSGRTYSLGTESDADYDLRLLGWKQHCFTWKERGQFKVSVFMLNQGFYRFDMQCKDQTSVGTIRNNNI